MRLSACDALVVIPSVAWESPGKAPYHTDVYAVSFPRDSHGAPLGLLRMTEKKNVTLHSE